MNRIEIAFEKKIFIPFITAGDPTIDKTEEFIVAMAEEGAGLIEIGIPFSDPIAEGPVIQAASERALKNRITLDKIFKMVENVRKKTQVPLVFMTYCNPVFNYGYEEFFKRCQQVGIDGIIMPEIPFEEKGEITPFTTKYGIKLISLITPASKDRIAKISKETEGFVYVVSSPGVTGVRKDITTDLSSIIKVIKSNTDTPCAIGFGINTTEQVKEFSQKAEGIIVGSAIVSLVEEYKEKAEQPIREYIKTMVEAL